MYPYPKPRNATTVISSRLPRALKEEATAIFAGLNLTPSDAIKALCRYIARTGTLPFPVTEHTVSKDLSTNTSGRIPTELMPVIKDIIETKYQTTISAAIWSFFEATVKAKALPFDIEDENRPTAS